MSHPWLCLILCMPVPAAALFQNTNSSEFWDNFANNFASDLAPIISLFGEQVTKQFLTESTTPLDYVLFAMAPLGVLTAVVSVIRVRGSSTLKSIIGRAREPHALAEVELCSSTSQDVCELWSNGGICRVFGRPKILEFMYRQPSPKDFYPSFKPNSSWNRYLREEPTCGIDLPRNVLGPLRPGGSKDASETQRSDSFGQWEEVAPDEFIWSPMERYVEPLRKAKPVGDSEDKVGYVVDEQERKDKFAPHPNPSLNIGRRGLMLSVIDLWIASTLGILVQASFFVYATWATWYHSTFYAGGVSKNILPFFVLGLSGTGSLMAGMALSAKLIDTKSEERRFVDCTKEPSSLIFWLQPVQRIGDQRFNAFAHAKKCSEYITSWKLETKDNKENGSLNEILVWTSLALSVLGWAAQFIGLRGMHPSISLYQLVCTLIMSVVRAMIRSSQFDDRENLLQELGQQVEGHELDWQAFFISQMNGSTPSKIPTQSFFIEEQFDLLCEVGNAPSMSSSAYRFSPNGFLGLFSPSVIPGLLMEHACNQVMKFMEGYSGSGFIFDQKQRTMSSDMMQGMVGDGDVSPNDSAKLVRTRLRLAQLTSEPLVSSDQTWDTEIRVVALKLKAVLEKSADYIFSNRVFPGLGRKDHDAILWTLTCRSVQRDSKDILCFSMLRQNGNWKMDANLLEATLSLWHWSLQEQLRTLRKQKPYVDHDAYFTKKRLIFEPNRWLEANLIFRLWILQESTGNETHYTQKTKARQSGNLSIPAALCILEDLGGGTSMRAEDLNMLSVDAESSLLHLMAQDLFSIFINRLASLMTKPNMRFTNITADYERSDGLSISTSAHTNALVDMLVSEGLASKQEALMTTIPSLFPEGLFSEYQLFSWALSQAETMKDEKRFRESEKILKVLLDLTSSAKKRRSELALCELYRAEFRWMIRNPQLKKKDLAVKYDSFRQHARSGFDNVGNVYLDAFKLLFPQIDDSWSANEAAKVLPRTTGQTLSEGKLEELGLDEWNQRGSTYDTLTIALALDERFDLSKSSFTVRLQLLRWAIEFGSVGLIQDLRDSEKRSNLRSVFLDGPELVIWAIATHQNNKPTVDMIHFIINVAEVNIGLPIGGMNAEFIDDVDFEDESISISNLTALAWKRSQKKHKIHSAYQKYGSVLAAATVMPAPENAEVITLLIDRIGQRRRRNNQHIELSRALHSGDYGNALIAAVCGVTSDAFVSLLDQYYDDAHKRLRSGMWHLPQRAFLNEEMLTGRFGTVVIAAAYWGRRDCLERILVAQRNLLSAAKKYRGASDNLSQKIFEDVVISCGMFETPMEAAKAQLSDEDKIWAESRFVPDKQGAVELLEKWMKEER